ncbi:MAG: hypothetical protein RL672_713 [Actinomycetota bacterium]
MTALTQPIRIVFNTNEPGYKAKTWLAYIAVFTLMAGDAVRYSIGWWGWGVLLVGIASTAFTLFFRSKRAGLEGPAAWLGRVPVSLYLLLGWMLLSTAWSVYQPITLLACLSQFATTLFGVFLAGMFSWRHLLRIFANVIRTIIIASLAFEVVAAIVGPIAPIFGNYSGNKPPTPEYYWTRGNLLQGERIQGIVGNSNLLAYVAMIGIVIFAVEYAILAGPRWLSVLGLAGSALCLALAKSAGIGFAMMAVAAAAIVSIAAEGKSRETRHRYYRMAWFAAGTLGFFVLVYRAQVFEFFGKSPDMTGRSGIWKAVLHLVAQKPYSGWGWISYWVPGVEPYAHLIVIKGVPYYQAHNAYLDVWLQLGLVGVAIFLTLLVVTFIKLWRLAVRHTSVLYLWPILVFVGILTQNLTESRMLIEIGWVFLALFAVKANEPSEALEPKGRSPKRARLLSLGLLRNRFQRHTDR